MRASLPPTLWEDPSPLCVSSLPRVVLVAPPAGTPVEFSTILFRSTVARFATTKFQDLVLGTVQKRMGFSGGAWEFQQPFLKELFESFFNSDWCHPAWVKVATLRQSFVSRIASPAVKIQQGASSPRSLFGSQSLGTSKLLMNGVDVSTERLLMQPPPDVRISETAVSTTQVFRRFSIGKSLIWATENWSFLGDGSPEEAGLVMEGASPVAEQFRDAAGLQLAPLMSLCKLSSQKTVSNRCVTFTPGEGRVADVRCSEHPLEYYMRSDMTNHELLKLSTESNGSEPV